MSAEVMPLEGDPDKELSIVTKEGIDTNVRKKAAQNDLAEVMSNDRQMIGKEASDSVKTTDIPQKIDSLELVTEEDQEMPNDFLPFLEEEDRIKVWNKIQNIQVDENAKLHKALIQYKKRIADYKEKLKKAKSKPYYNPSRDKPKDEPEFFKEVSNEGIKRATVIMNTLFLTVEQLGGKVYDDLSVMVKKDRVRIRVAEGQDKVKHELTKQEANALVKYNDEIKQNHWASKPKIKQYDYFYNGRLRVIFDGDYIRESSAKPLEDCLGDMLICIYKKSEEHRIEREQQEERNRIREEERRKAKEQQERKVNEARRTIELENMAEDFEIATKIRAFVRAKKEAETVSNEWIEWAYAKADWYDPTVSAKDELLGTREHGKSIEEKKNDLIQKSRNWSWY